MSNLDVSNGPYSGIGTSLQSTIDFLDRLTDSEKWTCSLAPFIGESAAEWAVKGTKWFLSHISVERDFLIDTSLPSTKVGVFFGISLWDGPIAGALITFRIDWMGKPSDWTGNISPITGEWMANWIGSVSKTIHKKRHDITHKKIPIPQIQIFTGTGVSAVVRIDLSDDDIVTVRLGFKATNYLVVLKDLLEILAKDLPSLLDGLHSAVSKAQDLGAKPENLDVLVKAEL